MNPMKRILNRSLLLLPLAALLLISGCASAPPILVTRYAWVTGFSPEKAERYNYLHSHPWPAVNKMIKDCHIQTL